MIGATELMGPAGKRSKSSVNYSLGGDHCDVCVHFIEDETSEQEPEIGACELVEGQIREDYWCKLFKRKKGGAL